MSEQVRNQIFISYSHRDKIWLDELHTHLIPCLKQVPIEVWDDTKIKTGELWKDEISKALNSARIAILLVSPAFLASEFISNNELPHLLEAAEQGGLTIFWVPVRPSVYHGTAIQKYQAVISPDRPLSKMKPSERDEKLVGICKQLQRTISSPPTPTPKRKQRASSTIKQSKNPDGVPLGWTLCFIGKNQYSQLGDLIRDLRRPKSSNGDGKRFVSGFSYWGPGPTIAWTRACDDPFYRVMHDSIETFPDRWRDVSSAVGEQPCHFVSLGIGTGHKDRDILRLLRQFGTEFFYIPVDMSLEMLSIGIGRTRMLLAPGKLRPVQIDFSSTPNVESLRKLLDGLLHEEPILFSLLGNTLANFDEDMELLSTLSGLLREQDLFLLEVAHTDSLEDAAQQRAADEYASSPDFKYFATSALFQHTDIPIDLESVLFVAEREDERAIRIKVLYRNQTDTKLAVTLPDRQFLTFPPDDTIRLYLSRKYKQDRVEELVEKCGFSVVKKNRSSFQDLPRRVNFGTDLLLLRKLKSG